ncbi:TetR/AcrR family transcriptional regulator [Nocardiopsis alba]|uniref:TetR/AcrR family transcriptional regulator n=1 Tax=Nocardiopsis alba TaxID=53437 RepID=UPI00366DC337
MVNIGLRERKRRETRQRISDRATRLFERDGFETVTLAQIAEASDVSIKTVTNYFTAKEDLFFDAEPAVLDALITTIEACDGPAVATEVLRPLILDGPLLADPRRWADVGPEDWEGMRRWSRCERDSPTLTAGRSAILHSWIAPLSEAGGSRAWAGLLVGALLLRHDLFHEGILRREEPEEIEHAIRGEVGQALDALGTVDTG